jgi:hypothetical protein
MLYYLTRQSISAGTILPHKDYAVRIEMEPEIVSFGVRPADYDEFVRSSRIHCHGHLPRSPGFFVNLGDPPWLAGLSRWLRVAIEMRLNRRRAC